MRLQKTVKNILLKKNKNNFSIFVFFLGLALISTFGNFLVSYRFHFLFITIFIGSINVCFSIGNMKIDSIKLNSIFLLFWVIIRAITLTSHDDKVILFQYIIYILLLITIILYEYNISRINFLINVYILSVFIITIIILMSFFRNGYTRFSVNSTHGLFDPNFLSSYMVSPAILCLIKAVKFYNKLIKFSLNIILFGLISTGILLTGSRASLIALLISCLFVLINILIINKMKLKNIILIAFVLGLAVIIIFNLLPAVLKNRYFSDTYMDESNMSRLERWSLAIQSFISKPIFGIGIIRTADYIYKEHGVYYAAHNTYIGLAMQMGLIGLIPFLSIHIKLLQNFFSKSKIILLGLLLSLIFTSIIIEATVFISIWLNLGLLYSINKVMDKYNLSFYELLK